MTKGRDKIEKFAVAAFENASLFVRGHNRILVWGALQI